MPTWHDRLGELEKATELPARFREEIEQFFLSATFFTDKAAKIKGWRGPQNRGKTGPRKSCKALACSGRCAPAGVTFAKAVDQVAFLISHRDQNVERVATCQEQVPERHRRRSPHTKDDTDVHRVTQPPVQ